MRIDPLTAYQFERDTYNRISEEVETNAQLIEEAVVEIVSKYSAEIDELVNEIHEVLHKHNNIENYELDVYIAKIPTFLYYASQAQEFTGIREDTARIIRQKVYIKARKNASGTVADKDTIAEDAAQQESLTAIVYSRATKMLKHKVDMALELLSALKKICSRRMDEYHITKFSKDD